MRYLSLPLVLLAVLSQVGMGLPAELPAKCSLELVRLQPLMSGKPMPDDERFVRFPTGRLSSRHGKSCPR